MIEFPGLWSLTPIGFGIGVVALFYWLLATGRLIPRSSHERELGVANRRGDEWKETALAERSGRHEVSAQLSKSLEANRVWEAVIRSAAPGVTFEDTQPKVGP